MVAVLSGYLIKQPVHGHMLSRPRKRYFVLSDDPHLEWFADEQARAPKDRLKLQGARIERAGQRLTLHTTHGDGRHASLTISGEVGRSPTLDEWEAALRRAAAVTSGSASLAPEAVTPTVLEHSIPDEPSSSAVEARTSLELGQSVSTGAELGGPAVASQSTKSLGGSGMAFSAFLTHDWGTDEKGRDNHARVAAVHAALTAAGMRCWFDEEQMQGNINKQMTKGIDGSAVIVAFITSRYVTKVNGDGPNGEDDNCKFEFDYALLRKGVSNMVACVMEPGMRNPKTWAGVVGGKLGSSLYVDLSHDVGDDGFASGVQRLAKEIQSRFCDSFSFKSVGWSAGSFNASTAAALEPSYALHPTPQNSLQEPSAQGAALNASLAAAAQAVVQSSPHRNAQPADSASAQEEAAAIHAAAKEDVSRPLAPVPKEVPMLPESAVERPDLMGALKQRVLRLEESGGANATAVTAPPKKSSNTTSTNGMGGVGKTTTTAALVRDSEVRSRFDRICWVSVGQEPDTATLQQTLYKQLVTRPLPEAAKTDEQLALGELKKAAKDLTVLLVLDDVWVASHATPLNFVDPAASSSAVVVTTRIRSLLGGATEVQCEVMDEAAALELLLRTGGCEDLLGAPPPAAIEAVRACGRLPLALGIAGGMIQELADCWQTELVAELEQELEDGEESIEERVVNASLRVMPGATKQGVEQLFILFGVFAEDAVVPAAVIDVVAPLMAGAGGDKQPSTSKRQTRKLLQQLLKANLLRGSIEGGVFVHDLVRDCMIRRAQAAREGGLRATQREAVPLLLAAFDDSAHEAAAGYVAVSLQWHVREVQQPGVAVDADTLLMQVLEHEAAAVRKQGALGVGVGVLRAAADACDSRGEHLVAAELMYAAGAVRGSAAGAEMRRAWESLRRLVEAGGGTSWSSVLEGKVLNTLVIATEGGFATGTAEHEAVMQRMRELGTRGSVQDGLGDAAPAVAPMSTAASASRSAAMAAMEAEYGLGVASIVTGFGLDGVARYPGPTTQERVVEVHGLQTQVQTHMLSAAKAAPDAPSAASCWSFWSYGVMGCPRQHRLAEFNPDVACGKGGVRLREIIERYDFGTFHTFAKGFGMTLDGFMQWGSEPLGLLLFWGDVAGMRAGLAKAVDAHAQVAARVRRGEATADTYSYEGFTSAITFGAMLLAADERDVLRKYLADSLVGMALTDDAARAGMASFWSGAFTSWKTDDGHFHSTLDTWLLLVRGLKALADEVTEARRAALQAWLPPPAELLRIAEYECSWRGLPSGASHPSLLCARLYGEQLGNWQTTFEVVEGVLAIEAFNPLLRCEAYRLLGRARAELGQREKACEAFEAAVAEAVKAKYKWFELLALRDLLRCCEASQAERARQRLGAVVARMAATPQELVGVLGEGVLAADRLP